MPDVLQFAKEFGLPLGLLVVAVLVLWKKLERSEAKKDELYERWAKAKRGEEETEVTVKMERMLDEANRVLGEMRARRKGESGEGEMAK